jgi:2-aminoethylphosphonate-pyruvate transaminase
VRSILLNPGPVSLSEGVRNAVASTDLCHREAEYFDVQDEVITGLLQVYDCERQAWAAVLMGGSGTTAMEAMLASLLPSHSRLLVIENGIYGERLSRIAEIHALEHAAMRLDWGAGIDLAALGELLGAGGFSHLAAVHHETTTGRLNDVAAIADLCEQHGVSLLLDSVSAFGAEAVPFDSPAVMAVAATANKCLHGIPGLAIVLCRRKALEQAPTARSLTLHLPDWASHQARRSTPYTPPVNAVLALSQALRELRDQGGWQARGTHYRKLAGQVATTLGALGVDPWLPAAESSCALRSYRLPPGMDYNALHAGLKQRGFIIYAGQGGLFNELFRLSTMGEISAYDMARLQQALRAVIAGR